MANLASGLQWAETAVVDNGRECFTDQKVVKGREEMDKCWSEDGCVSDMV